MRVLHLTTEFPPVIYGGLGTAVGGLVKASAIAGMSVGVLLVGPHAGDAYGEIALSPSEPYALPLRSTPEAVIFEVSFQDFEAMARLAARWRPDVLHLHSFWLWPVAQALRQRLGTPLVYTVHSLDRAEYELGHGPPECVSQWTGQEEAIYSADRVIALTRSERELLKDYCPGVEDRIRIVGNGIEDSAIFPSVKSDQNASPIVLFSGRFVERKGIRELMQAMAIVLAELPEVRFVLAGGHRHCTGEQMQAWLSPAHLLPYRRQIQFTGWLTPNQMSEWYRAADILVVLSWYEPFGMVILEGMLHGLAIAASAIGGPAEILEHESTGLLFEPKSGPALAEAILRLARDSTYRRRMAKAASQSVRQRWLWPKIIDRMRTVYEELAVSSRLPDPLLIATFR
jgi:glycosyltransferase involved in cell wall biosynthesis